MNSPTAEYSIESISTALTDLSSMRRRPPGEKVLVYLDQNTYSSLARSRDESPKPEDRAHRPLMDFLEEGVRADRITCIDAPEHADESLVAADRDAFRDTRRLLSMGVGFKGWDEILWEEVYSIAAEFSGEQSRSIDWHEAFYADPHAAREVYFPGGLQVSVDMGVADWQVESVQNQKELEATLEELYEIDRAKGWSHEQMISVMFNDIANIHLRWLFDRQGFGDQLLALDDRMQATPFDPLEPGEEQMKLGDRFMDMAVMRTRCAELVERYPAIANDLPGFKLLLTRSPMIALPALLRSAIIEMPGRKPNSGDGYDIKHLTNGLSRCDFVTGDAGMTQLCRNAKLIPDGCQLFNYREHPELLKALEVATR